MRPSSPKWDGSRPTGRSAEVGGSAPSSSPRPPLREPVARMGSFVMNTKAGIRQAVADSQAGRC